MNWPEVPLADVAKIVSGATPKTSDSTLWNGGIAWATPKDLSRLESKHLERTERTISQAGLTSCAATLLPKSSVLFSSRAPIGLVAINKVPVATNQGFKSFVPKSNLDSGYLFWWLKHNRARIEALGNGATFKEVSKAVVSRISIPLPPVEEQRWIAKILDKADAIRRKREQSLAHADELLKSVFLEMFGDPVSNPRGWPIAHVDDLGDVQGGLQVSKKRNSLSLRLPYLRVANVYRNKLALSEIKEIGLTQAEFRRTKLESGDVLIVEGHGNPGEIGRASVWDGSIGNCVHQNHLIRFRADRTAVSPVYLSRLLNSKGGRMQLIAAGRTTSGLNTISTKKVKDVTIPLPPIEEQLKFESIVAKQAQAVISTCRARDEAIRLFASLSQRAFAGEL